MPNHHTPVSSAPTHASQSTTSAGHSGGRGAASAHRPPPQAPTGSPATGSSRAPPNAPKGPRYQTRKDSRDHRGSRDRERSSPSGISGQGGPSLKNKGPIVVDGSNARKSRIAGSLASSSHPPPFPRQPVPSPSHPTGGTPMPAPVPYNTGAGMNTGPAGRFVPPPSSQLVYGGPDPSIPGSGGSQRQNTTRKVPRLNEEEMRFTLTHDKHGLRQVRGARVEPSPFSSNYVDLHLKLQQGGFNVTFALGASKTMPRHDPDSPDYCSRTDMYTLTPDEGEEVDVYMKKEVGDQNVAWRAYSISRHNKQSS